MGGAGTLSTVAFVKPVISKGRTENLNENIHRNRCNQHKTFDFSMRQRKEGAKMSNQIGYNRPNLPEPISYK